MALLLSSYLCWTSPKIILGLSLMPVRVSDCFKLKFRRISSDLFWKRQPKTLASCAVNLERHFCAQRRQPSQQLFLRQVHPIQCLPSISAFLMGEVRLKVHRIWWISRNWNLKSAQIFFCAEKAQWERIGGIFLCFSVTVSRLNPRGKSLCRLPPRQVFFGFLLCSVFQGRWGEENIGAQCGLSTCSIVLPTPRLCLHHTDGRWMRD